MLFRSPGARLLRAWLLRPLLDVEAIHDRLDAVEELAFRTLERAKSRETLKGSQDLQRLVARAAIKGFERGSTANGDGGDSHWEVLLNGLTERIAVSRRQQHIVRDIQNS